MPTNFDFLFITFQAGLLIVDVPATSAFLNTAIGTFLLVSLVNFVLRVLKLIPFL
jgi:hypothetical protein